MRIIWQRPDEEGRKITKMSKVLTEEQAIEFEAKLDGLKLVHKRIKDKIPSVNTLAKYMDDGICPTPCGCRVEPDGTCIHGWDSWLLIMKVI